MCFIKLASVVKFMLSFLSQQSFLKQTPAFQAPPGAHIPAKSQSNFVTYYKGAFYPVFLCEDVLSTILYSI